MQTLFCRFLLACTTFLLIYLSFTDTSSGASLSTQPSASADDKLGKTLSVAIMLRSFIYNDKLYLTGATSVGQSAPFSPQPATSMDSKLGKTFNLVEESCMEIVSLYLST